MRGPFDSDVLRGAREREHDFERDQTLQRVVARITGEAMPPLFGRFRLSRALGRGSHGQVYEAWDLRLDRRVALKVITDRNHRAADEARALAGVDDPGVVRVHELIEKDDCTLVVMQFVDAVTADRWVLARGRHWRTLVLLMAQVADALHAVHQAGLVHGDVKPSNILVQGDGRGVLIDFSLARRNPHDPAGTPRFMAPEARTQAPTVRSDQYSFFMTLQWLLGAAVDGRTPAQRPRPTHRRTGLGMNAPRALTRMIARGLAADPGDRFEDMDTVAAVLRRLASKRQRRGLEVTIVGLVVVAAMAGWSASRQHRCDEVASVTSEVWTDDARRGLMEAELPQGATMAPLVARIDEVAASWAAAVRARCLAPMWPALQAELSPCLEDARQGLALVVETATASPVVALAQADVLTAVLPDIGRCKADPNLADEGLATDAVEEFLRTREELRRLTLALETDPDQTELRLVELEQTSPPVPCAWRPDLLLLRSRRALLAGEMAAASGLAVDAAIEAETCRRPGLELRAQVETATILAMAGHVEDADHWVRMVEGTLRRSPALAFEAWRAHQARGLLAYARGDVKAALEAYRDAEAVLAQRGEVDSEVTGKRIAMLGLMKDPQAVADAEAWADAQGRVWGAGHPHTARAWKTLGNAYLYQRRLDDGAAALRKSLAIYARWGDALARERLSTQLNLATALQVSRPAEAEVLLEEYVLDIERAMPRSSLRGEALSVLASVQWKAHREADALATARRAANVLEALAGVDDPATLQAWALQGRLLAVTGQARQGAEMACGAARRLYDSGGRDLAVAPGVLLYCLRSVELAAPSIDGAVRAALLGGWVERALAACSRVSACDTARRIHGELSRETGA